MLSSQTCPSSVGLLWRASRLAQCSAHGHCSCLPEAALQEPHTKLQVWLLTWIFSPRLRPWLCQSPNHVNERRGRSSCCCKGPKAGASATTGSFAYNARGVLLEGSCCGSDCGRDTGIGTGTGQHGHISAVGGTHKQHGTCHSPAEPHCSRGIVEDPGSPDLSSDKHS